MRRLTQIGWLLAAAALAVLASTAATASAAPPSFYPPWPGSSLPGNTLPGLVSLPGVPPTAGPPPVAAPPPSGTPGTPAPTPAPGARPGTLSTRSYGNAAGSRAYELYVPSTYKAGTPTSLIVALHACTQTADGFRKQTRLDQLAQSRGFIVVFPEQPSSANYMSCWNWFSPANMQRGSGEPSIIAGITQSIEQQYSVDHKRVYVMGLSAGGAMANVMGATYPDLYAAVGSGSGCEFNGLPCVGSPGPDAVASGTRAYQAMGSYARPVPAIVFQGDADTTVVPANGGLIVRQWQTAGDLADDGSMNRSIPVTPSTTAPGQVAGGRAYTVASYGNGQGGELVQYWVVKGMNHAWSGAPSSIPYSDPTGPDESAAMLDFFAKHPMP